MKRLIAAAVALMLVLCAGTALGEQPAETAAGWEQFGQVSGTVSPTETPAPNAFRFRDGIRWGMNTELVKALETEPMAERTMQDWSVLFTGEKVAVSRFTADLIFMFRGNRLLMITYEFSPGTEDSFLYLTGALSSVYGEKADAEPLKIKALMDAVNPSRYRTDAITRACGWNTADGTSVYLYYYTQNDFAIMYVSPEQGSRIYQINGL